jgi:hypothetical protein
MNSYIDKLFLKRKRVGYFIIVRVVVQRDNEHETTVKGNNNAEWSSDGVVL